MKTWTHQVDVPKHGVCTVKEAKDSECTEKIAPVAHGFVNLYKGEQWVDWCGFEYAKKYLIDCPDKDMYPLW